MGSTWWGFPTLTCSLFFSEPVIFENLYHIFLPSVGTFTRSFFFFFFSVPYFGLARDHGNSFLCPEE